MTTGTENELTLSRPESVPREVSPTDPGTLADARAEACSWSPSIRRVYVADWNHFTIWCIEKAAPRDS